MTDLARLRAIETTEQHIARVNGIMQRFAEELLQRGQNHDASKLDEVELGPLTEMQKLIDAEGQAPYGSEEYKRRTALLGPMIEHHYQHNSHHPEHYANGVNGMDLFDLIEMAADWKAASERGEETAINLSHSLKRFEISEQLADVLRNTFARLGWAVK